MPIANEDGDSQDALLEAAAHRHYVQARADMGGDSEFTELIEAITAECPHISAHEAQDILDCLKDKGVLSSARRLPLTSKLPAWVAKVQKLLRYIKNHPNSNAIYAALYVWDEPLLDDINGNLSQTEFANKMYPSTKPVNPAKAAVNNAVKDAQRFFNLPPRSGQRSTAACETMSQKTIERLEKKL